MMFMRKYFIAQLFLFVFACSSYSQSIDLTRRDFFVKTGFQKAWLAHAPLDSTWLRIPASNTGHRPIRVAKLDLPELKQPDSISAVLMK
ncbi:MAG: hypothetical protein ACE5I1_12500 [bacterium]